MIDLWIDIAFGAVLVAVGPVAGRAPDVPGRSTVAGYVAAVSPAALSVLLVLSLAVHGYAEFGSWPPAPGTEGLPQALAIHAAFSMRVLGMVAAGGLFVWPLALLITTIVPAMRRDRPFVLAYGAAAAVAVGVTLLAPAPFRTWWWD